MPTLPVIRALSSVALAALMLPACSKPSATGAATEAAESSGTPSAPHVSAPPAAASPSAVASAAPEPPPATSAAPVAAASAAPAPPAPVASAPPATSHVKVVHIGMHIGGGPNDDVTKEPIRASVRPHFDALAACYAATGSKVVSDFGVDLLIPEAGGKAQVSHPRSTLKGAPPELSTCIVAVFEGTEFKKPLTGRTVVSYSMRFTP